jgi:membrane fusion protein, macrolide-specific efflux system
LKRNLIIFISAVLVLGITYFVWNKIKGPSITYDESKVEKGDIALTILATGTVQPENRLEIKPPVAGRVEQVLVKEGEKVTKGQILAWMSSNERAALIDAARSQGKKELKRWEELFRPTPVIAPIDGTIILRNVEEGQSFTSADAILVMSDRLTVKAQVDETDMAFIKLKQDAEIILDAYSSSNIEAIVDQIAFEAKTINNVTTYVVDVLPKETPDFMRAGMTANVTFYIETKSDVIVVPSEFIKMDAEFPSVLIRDSDGNISDKKIKIGISDGKQTEVVSGLSVGEIVLLEKKEKTKTSDSPFSMRGKKKEKTDKKKP